MALTTPQGYGLGVRFDLPEDRRNWAYPFVAAAPPGDIDLRTKMLPVGNQESIGSCTGWAGTAALEAALGGSQRSPLYVYYYDRLEDGSSPTQDVGATMLGLCKALQRYGAAQEGLWPYDTTRFSRAPTHEADVDAAQARILSYYQVKASGQALLQGIWAALANGQVPLVALNIYDSFTRTGSTGKVVMPSRAEVVRGGHALPACGWFNDNSAPGGLGYLMCQNSWGAGFGDMGYVYLPAGYFLAGIVVEGWVIEVGQAPPPPPPPPPPPSSSLRALVEDASKQVKQVRAEPTAEWPEGTLERADADLDAALRLLPVDPVPPPAPPPTPPSPVTTAYQGFAVSYPGHDPARDAYLGVTAGQKEWGPHHGLPILAPAPGRVELYRFPTPLATFYLGDTQRTALYHQRQRELFGEGWICRAPDVGGLLNVGEPLGSQVMYVALYIPDSPIRLANGQQCKAMWFGHVKDDVLLGTVGPGERIATSWDSGIRFEANGITARAAHVHVCGTATGTLSMNGDVDGLLVAQALGWQVEWRGFVGPGPNEYLSGLFVAGKRKDQWAGHLIPPIPN